MKLIMALKVLLLLAAVNCYASAGADSIKRQHPYLADIPGFVTLKCDFHMHTVFSDGHVWPSFRVHEAERDGLDAISLTEHIDFEGFPEDLKRDVNRSYEIARETAKKGNLIVIKGVEISPRVPPYHNNALFVKDANKIPYPYMKNIHKEFVMKDNIKKDELMAPFLEVQRQGAFVFYNHPGYAWWDKKDREIFTTFHKELLEKKILAGVEVVNSGRYNIIAHNLAMKYNLTMMANSDEHYDMGLRYQSTHRPMTLVFAKERSAEGIKEALLARRTAVYNDDLLIGRKAELEPFFRAAVTVKTVYKKRNEEPILVVTLENHTDIPFRLKVSSPDYMVEDYPMGRLTVNAGSQATVILKAVWDAPASTPLDVKVENVLVDVNEELGTTLRLVP